MNAHEYVAKHGVERTKECLPSYIKHYCGLERIFIDELKQVVESVELIKKLGGLIAAKSALTVLEFETGAYPEKVKQAIADYELVESYKQVKCEVLDMVDDSPRCEVINETH